MSIGTAYLEISRDAYRNFSVLCHELNDYAYDGDEEKLNTLLKVINVGMPLPSGRYGNSLAVALEMQLYVGALFIIKHADELGIDLKSISSERGGKDPWNAFQVFELSQLGFSKDKVSYDDEYYKDYPQIIESKNHNIDAAEEISGILKEKFDKKTK